MRRLRAWGALGLLALCSNVSADEGFWRGDRLPLDAMQARYQTQASALLVQKLRDTSLRLSNGCSASIVSPQGLVLTNRHCLRTCLAQLSGIKSNLLRDGYSTRRTDQELSCPALVADQLLSIENVSDQLATAELSDAEARARMIQRCRAQGPQRHCELQDWAERGQTMLASYIRHRDLRLVFAPEAAVSQHQGSKTFPRYTLDFAVLRLWENEQPLATAEHLSLQSQGPQSNELLILAGFPASGARLNHPAELSTLTKTVIPYQIEYLRGRKLALSGVTGSNTDTRLRERLSQLTRREQNLRVQLALLQNEQTQKQLSERAEQFQKILKTSKPAKNEAADYWRMVDELESAFAKQYREFQLIEMLDGFQSQRYQLARQLVRAAIERDKPDDKRLAGYRAAALPQLTQSLFTSTVENPALDRASFGHSLSWLRDSLGEDHPVVSLALAEQSPAQRAEELIKATRIDRPALRRELWEGGLAAIQSAKDPMIQLAWQLEPFVQDIRQNFERIESARQTNRTALSRALWMADPEAAYPSAKHDFRISYGELSGWVDSEREVLATTSFAGFLAQLGSGSALPHPDWAAAANEFELSTVVNFASTHDSVAGNSGSAIVNLSGELVGLVFDTNSYGLLGQSLYDERFNRAVSVHPAIILESLSRVYDQANLVDELTTKP